MQDEKDLERRLIELESRLEALERWKASVVEPAPARPAAKAPTPKVEVAPPPAVAAPVAKPAAATEIEVVQPPQIDFDISLVGRTLIVLGGAFLLRAITESGTLPATLGVSLGLAYAVTWLVVALRPSVSRTSAAYHGVAAIFTAYPLIFEATRKFHVLGAWSSALVLVVISAIWVALTWRKMLYGLAWVATIGGMATAVLLMAETSSMVPFVWYMIGLGVTTLWMGYHLRWLLLRWPVAALLDATLLLMAFLVVTDRIVIAPIVALATAAAAFAAYLGSFVLRNIVRERNVVLFDVAQTVGSLICGLGGAMWIAGAKHTVEIPFALAVLVLAAACYGVSFVFIPRHEVSPNSFFFYSTLALVLVLGGAAFITKGLPSSILWSALALTSAYFAGRYSKPVLAVHCAIYLVAGVIGARLVQGGVRILALDTGGDWSLSWASATLILVAAAIAASLPPIERKGTYSIWMTAKLAILAVAGWTGATLAMALVGLSIHGTELHPGMIAFERTAILSGLTVASAWAARWVRFAPGRRLANVLMIVIAMKLIWDDLRLGTPVTMFLSFACVGAAMIITTKLRKNAVMPGVEAAA